MDVGKRSVCRVSCRCYTAGGEDRKTQAQIVEEDRQEALKELEPLKMPRNIAEYMGNVMYPNEESAAWDVDSKFCPRALSVCGLCVCGYISESFMCFMFHLC